MIPFYAKAKTITIAIAQTAFFFIIAKMALNSFP
jgi:hypothetical protein